MLSFSVLYCSWYLLVSSIHSQILLLQMLWRTTLPLFYTSSTGWRPLLIEKKLGMAEEERELQTFMSITEFSFSLRLFCVAQKDLAFMVFWKQYLKRASLLKKNVISEFLEINTYLRIHIKLSQGNEQVNINDVSFPLEKKHL